MASNRSTSELTPGKARALLRTLAVRIERLDVQREAAFAQRLEAIEVLSEAGMTQAQIGELARVTPMAIAQQLHKSRLNGTARTTVESSRRAKRAV